MNLRKQRLALASLSVVAAVLGLTSCSSTTKTEVSEPEKATLAERLSAQFAGARVTRVSDAVTRVFGPAMSVGQSSGEASRAFAARTLTALGHGQDELREVSLDATGARAVATASKPVGLMYDQSTKSYKYWLYRYAQIRGGLRVHDAELLTVVKNGGDNAVVMAATTLRDLGDFAVPAGARARGVDLEKSQRALPPLVDHEGRVIPPPRSLARASAPELVVFAGKGASAAPKLSMRYTAEGADAPGRWQFVADAATGEILEVTSLISFADVSGSVAGLATQGDRAAECAEEVSQAFGFADVVSSAGTGAITDATGAFVLPNGGTEPVSLTSSMTGQFFDVVNCNGDAMCSASHPEDDLTLLVTPPGPAAFLHNQPNTAAFTRAQSNGYVEAMQVRDFILSYDPNYPTIATQTNFPVYVNRSDGYCPGNAWYDGSSINFCVGNASYGNTSFGSINHHEYGHHMVSTAGSGQGAYGEGMSDTLAVLIAGEPGTGHGFYLGQCDNPLRTADNDCQYSASSCSTGTIGCGSAIHACGNLLSGIIWDIREELKLSEPDNYADIINQLVIDSVKLHTGTGIDGSIAVDLLTLDDDDGNISNGTPHRAEICAGFAAHGLACPELAVGLSVAPDNVLVSSGEVGGPFSPESVTYVLENLGPEPSLEYAVTIPGLEPWVTVTNQDGTLAVGETIDVVVAIDQDVAATLAESGYQAQVDFSNLTTGVGNTSRQVTLTVGGPQVIYTEDFEDETSGGYSLFGLWHTTESCEASLSGHSQPRALYFGDDASCSYDLGVVAGYAESPSITVENTSQVGLSLTYFLETEQSSSFDRATVELSVNGGAYQVVATNSNGALVDDGSGWQTVDIDLTQYFAGLTGATMTLRFGFDSLDGVFNNYAGFMVDDVVVRAFLAPDEICTTDAECDDGEACNGLEVCEEGACAPGTPMICDDGLFCNGEELCSDSECLPGTPVVCDDGIDCTVDSCDEVTQACSVVPDDLTCDDGDPCTGAEVCEGTLGCVAGTPLSCDDGNACTIDSCTAGLGCTTAPLSCDDGNVCTTDSCEPTLGCQSSNNTLACADDGSSCTNDVCSAGVCTHPDNGTCGVGPFQESAGMVVMEAENYHSTLARSSHSWTLTNNSSASNGKVMVASPNTGMTVNAGYVTTSPELAYQVNFTTTGTYHVWVRGSAPSGNDDSLHAGIDGTGPSTADRIASFPTSLAWRKSTMDGPVATLVVSTPGVHTFQLWMREDGMRADKIVLTTNSSYTPTGSGPTESPHTTGCTSNTQCNDGNDCTTDLCSAGVCQNAVQPNGTACSDDSNLCTDDVCMAGLCTHPANTASCPDDGDSCTDDVCTAGVCTHPDNGSCGCSSDSECDDGNVCTGDTCVEGACSNVALNDGDSCTDDGDSCTNDVCVAGVCTHPDNGSCGTSPCAGLCSNPTVFTINGSYQSGNLGIGATCHETASVVHGGNCGNMAPGRTLSVNGSLMSCNYQNWPSIPAAVNGGYCIQSSAGDYAWATFTLW